MLILLLASAFALSFAPLTQNAASAIVTIGAVTFNPADLKLTVPITSADDVSTTATGTYRVAIYATADSTEVLFEKAFTKAELDAQPHNVEVTLAMDEKLLGLKTLHVDVLEKIGAAEETMLEDTRKSVSFAAMATEVAIAKSGATTDAKVTFTLDGALADPIGETKFVFNGEDLAVTKEETANTYSVVITEAQILAAISPLGYFKGANLATSTLTISVLKAGPVVTLEHLDATKGKGTATNIPDGAKVWLKSGDATAKVLTPPEGKSYVEIPYTDFEKDVILYYTNAGDVPISLKTPLTAFAALAATPAWAIPTGADKTPHLDVSFAEDTFNDHKLILVVAGNDDVVKTVATKKVTFAPADLIGESAVVIHTDADGNVKSLPYPLTLATFTLKNGTATAENQPVEVEMTTGYYKAKPAGLFVLAEGQTDLTKGKYYAFTWDTAVAKKATADVVIADWKDITDKNIEAYVTPDYTTVPAKLEKLSEKFVVFTKVATPAEGAFSNIVSLMAVLLSVLVFAF